MRKLYSLIIALTALLGTPSLGQAQTIYNSQGSGSGGGTSFYNKGSAPLNMKAITQGTQSATRGPSASRYSGSTRSAYSSTAFDEQANALRQYREQRNASAQSSYADQLANITKMSQSVGTPQFNSSGLGAQNTLSGTNNAGAANSSGVGIPVQPYYRGGNRQNVVAPKKVFNSPD